MTKVCIIGKDLLSKKDEEFLAGKGKLILKLRTLEELMLRSSYKPDLIISDKAQSSDASFKEFSVKYKEVPKLIVSRDHSFTGYSSWMKNTYCWPITNPSVKEMDFLIARAIREKKIMTENIELKGRISSLKQEIDLFDMVSKTMSSKNNLDEILASIMKKSKKIIRAEAWSIYFLDEETGELVTEKSSGEPRERARTPKFRQKMGQGIISWVAKEGIPVVIPDVSKDERFFKGVDRRGVKLKSFMCVPIKNNGKVLGVLEISNNTSAYHFSKDDLELLMKLVDHAAIAIERASLYQKMAELSVTDDLTKLFNTRYLNRTLEIEVNRSNRYRTSLSLIFLDIDHFKVINDNFGHLVGSKLLVETGQLLIRGLRTIDIVARYGGDEFVIVLPQTPPAAAKDIAERIRKSLEQNVFLKKEGYSLRITASFGVASYPESAKSQEDLLRLADEAMYRVKYQTRNAVYAIV